MSATELFLIAFAGAVVGFMANEVRLEHAAASHYAELVVQCANGHDFVLGGRIVHCDYTDVSIWKDE